MAAIASSAGARKRASSIEDVEPTVRDDAIEQAVDRALRNGSDVPFIPVFVAAPSRDAGMPRILEPVPPLFQNRTPGPR